jgi:hypothetical protein
MATASKPSVRRRAATSIWFFEIINRYLVRARVSLFLTLPACLHACLSARSHAFHSDSSNAAATSIYYACIFRRLLLQP